MSKKPAKGLYQVWKYAVLSSVLLFFSLLALVAISSTPQVRAQSVVPFDVTPTVTDTPTTVPTPTPTTAAPTPTPTLAPTPTTAPLPTPTPTKLPQAPTPTATTPPAAPTATAQPIETVQPTPTSNALSPIMATATAQAKKGTPTPTASPSAAATTTTSSSNENITTINPVQKNKSNDSNNALSQALPIGGIVGMVTIAGIALVLAESRKRRRLQILGGAGVQTAPAAQFSQQSPALSPLAGNALRQTELQPHADQLADSGIADLDSIPPAMRAAMNNAAAAIPPLWVQELNEQRVEQTPTEQIVVEQIQSEQVPAPASPESASEAALFSSSAQPPQFSKPLAGNLHSLAIDFPHFMENGEQAIKQQSPELQEEQPPRTIAGIPPGSGIYPLDHTSAEGVHTPPPQADPFLEALMRQAQIGIFALPDQE